MEREITPEIEKTIKGWMIGESKYKDLPRKSYEERVKDCMEFYKMGGSIAFYNVYGLDCINFRNKEDFFTWDDVNVGGINKEKQARHKYKNLFSKKQFSEFMEENFPDYAPKIFYWFKGDKVDKGEFAGEDFLTAMNQLDNGEYFLKITDIDQGKGVFAIQKIGRAFVINNGEILIDELIEKYVKKSNYLILQEKLYNHPAIAAFNPSSLNTVRIVTTKFKTNPYILSATLRTGAKKDAYVDNACQGGTFIGINDKTGELMEWGYYEFGKGKTREKEHPISHIKYKGYKIPFWKETLEICKKVHLLADYYNSVAWDVAITNNGPKIIELNVGWGHDLVQAPHGGLKKKWLKLKEKV